MLAFAVYKNLQGKDFSTHTLQYIDEKKSWQLEGWTLRLPPDSANVLTWEKQVVETQAVVQWCGACYAEIKRT